MSNKPVLTYWAGRGRAESIRLMLTAAGVEWETAEPLTQPEQLERLRSSGKLKFMQVPLLEWNGVNYVQCGAIVRHIARKFDLYGRTQHEHYQVDVLFEGSRDFATPLMGMGMMAPKEETMATLKSTTLPRYMPIFEKELAGSKSGFLVGDGMTLADVGLFEALLLLHEALPESFEGYPKLTAFYEMMNDIPAFSWYLSGPKRHGPVNDKYKHDVYHTLGWK